MDRQTRAIVLLCLSGIVAGHSASFVVRGGALLQYLFTGVIGWFDDGFGLDAVGVNRATRTRFWRILSRQRLVGSLSYCWQG